MMPPKRRYDCRSLAPDILSNLPDNVIDIILMRLPTKDVVRTSVLSTKWRYNWCRVRKFKFDLSLWGTEKDLKYPLVKFTKIVYQLLTHHEGPLNEFELNITSRECKSCPNIDNFIYFLSKKGIQHLVLRFPRDGPYQMPSSLFKCSQLKHLNLHNCIIPCLSPFYGFDRLISLELCIVSISSEFLESIISSCLLLEQLVLRMPEILDKIEINAPMLRSFDFIGNICSIYLKNVPLLAKVSVNDIGYVYPEKFDCTKFFDSCSALEDLHLSFSRKFIADEVPTRLPYDLNRVKRFYLLLISLERYKLSHALCLIRSFPHLEYLEIEVGGGDAGVQESLKLKHFSDVTFNHLRNIKLRYFRRTAPQKQLIKLFLAKSPVLMKMIITPGSGYNKLGKKSKILAEISKFRCASPDAEIVYGWY